MSSPLAISDLSYSYGGRVVFRHLSANFVRGNWTVLVGHSGVGKTTLLHMLAGLLPPDSGRVESGNVVYMEQRDLLLPWKTALENVLIPFRLRGKVAKKDVERARFLMNEVELGNVARKYPHELSGGMQKRLSIVRTLLLDRENVLLDEPFGGLDVTLKEKIYAVCKRAFQGKTVLLVTHDPMEAARLGDELYTLRGPSRLAGPLRMEVSDGPRPLGREILPQYRLILHCLGDCA